MRKLKVDKFKFYLKILSIILIINLIIGYFPRNLAIADTVIGSNTDTINDADMADTDISNAVDGIDTRKASDTNADYLAPVTFYNYYSNYNLDSNYNNSTNYNDEYYDNQHYSFETFNRRISDYAKENNMLYPLYFGDFWRASGNNSNETVSKPTVGQPLSGTATNFYWALNRANRFNDKYDASVQGIVSNQLDENGNITQDTKKAVLDYENMNIKDMKYDANKIQVYDTGAKFQIESEKAGRNNVLKFTFPEKYSGQPKAFRASIPIIDNNYSSYSNYLIFDIYSELEDEGDPFIALKDKDNRQIAGWIGSYTVTLQDIDTSNRVSKHSGWQTVVIDLQDLKRNTNEYNGVWEPQDFDFYNVNTLWLGHWSKGSIYIDNIRFSSDLKTKYENTVILPYFNKDFLTENVAEVVQGLEFPFKIRKKNDCNYYVFSSGKSGYKEDNSTVTDVVRINKSRTHLDYWFDVNDEDGNKIVNDMNGVDGWGGGKNAPGYFPFNKPEDSSDISKLNYGFGTKLEIQFTLTQDGQIKTINNSNEKRDIQFNFKGDDDVWVYIDGNLVLDMGGAHSQTEGNINFKSRIARVGSVIKGPFNNHNLYQETEPSEKSFTLSSDSYINGDPSQGYNPSKVHTLTMFYMERGLIESNLYVDFNFIPVENELTVEKEVDITGVNEVLKEKTLDIAKTIDFTFKAKQDTVYKTGIEYELNGNEKLLKMNGEIFTLKDGDSAKFYSKFNKDSTVQIEELSDSQFTTSWEIKDTTVNLENENDKERNIVTGEGNATNEFIISTAVNAYDKMSHYVKFVNKINTGEIEIKKEVTNKVDENKEFKFKLTFKSILNQEINAINYNGNYSVFENQVYKEERNAVKIGDDWFIQIKAGEEAKINGIPVGTTYEIEEILDDGYVIENITADNSNSIENNKVTGIITTEISKHNVIYNNKMVKANIELNKVDSIDSSIKLEGAIFRLNKLKIETSNNGSIDEIIDEGFASIEVTTNQNGQAFFNDLPYGKYIITEIKAPEGYELLKEPIKFEVNKDNNNSVITIEVKNNKSIKLPIAGGNGNITSKYIGFMLIGLAGVLYSFMLIRNKKYKFN